MLMIEKQASVIRAEVSGLAEHRCSRVGLKAHLQTQLDRVDGHRRRGKVPLWRWRRKPEISAFEYTTTESPDDHIHR
ncbi:hypothetical protein CCUG60885_05008 [Mycobacteroides salmoniphilum]|uniref:Uncharacterized protein n=1 Tax=Mycobacteroides salmoniphilum TaxID=404941 RepID=A0A4R8S8T7_9MYCO|nr:hypothetical protein CCUG60885_05008 [Mycobacteroides salmoniphilum]TEA00891.1 hypothetical protein CCUG60883_04541 [Mycobacteroides salmoniphilum]